jgi:7-carboxy-7-deazaguanine synthase
VIDTPRLKIAELYRSIQGESTAAGLPCTLVRLTGCDLRCRWCDTAHAFEGGSWMTIEQLIARIAELGDDLVLITGGEPLLQSAVHPLMEQLLDRGTRVQLETGGHQSIADVDRRVDIVMDLKCPGSGETERNRLDNLDHLKPTDQLKLVIADRRDYEWARDTVRAHRLETRCQVLVSPVYGELEPSRLVEWLLADRLRVRLGLQLHKLIWSPEERGV